MKPSDSSATVASRSGLAVVIALAIVYVVWGSTYLGIHFALEGGFPPFLMAGGRFLVAGVLMYAVLSVIGVFLGDMLVAFVDPRIKLTEGE